MARQKRALRVPRLAVGPPARGAVLLLGLGLGVGGCSSGDSRGPEIQEPDEPVTLRDLTAERPAGPEEPMQAAPFLPYRLLVDRLLFTRPAPQLEIAVRMASDEGLDPDLLERWARNGLGIGHLPRERLGLLLANLPDPISSSNVRVENPNDYSSISAVGQPAATYYVQRTPVAGPTDVTALTGGEYQLLAQLQTLDDHGGSLLLDLLPHHRGPAFTLLPEPLEQRPLAGTSFHELRLEQSIDFNRIWVIWLRDPARPDTGEEALLHRGLDPEEPLLAGEALLSGERRGRPVQVLLLLTAEPR